MTDVFDINSSNLNDFIEKLNNNDKCTMIFIFANWCGHCKAMKPEMTKFKQELKADNNVPALVAFLEETDMTKNKDKIQDLPFANEVNGFPTIVYRDQGDDNFTSYSGDRTHQAFMKFIKQHAMKGGRKKKGGHREFILGAMAIAKAAKFIHKKLSKKKRKKRKTKKRKGGKWSLKYKRSINCKKPKGFSQKQYCKRVQKRKRKTKKTRKRR